jgi:hypothetical protein
MTLASNSKLSLLELTVAKSLVTLLKSMEEATSYSTYKTVRFVSHSCDIVGGRYHFISFILLKEHSQDATETINVNGIRRAVAKVL